jgi:RNA-directed DNA polymerase
MTTTTKALEQSSDELMEKIVDPDNLERAWKKVRSNHGAPGPDGITIDDFPEYFREHWPVIKQQLLDGTYTPGPARRKSIDKPDGGQRDLSIPNVIERLIQQAILQLLTPIFDPGFCESSFGFRPKRSAQDAAKQVQRYIRLGYRQCVDMDLAKFFDKVQHDVLMVRVARKVSDRRLLKLIGRYLRAGVLVDTELQPSIEGTMQGSPLSPILANILVINHQKSRVCGTDGVEFLGFAFEGYGGHFRVSPKNQKKFKARVREITRRNRGVPMSHRLRELQQYFQGWVGYFSLMPMKTYFQDLDKWVRRRIRSCYWKQWRNPRTRIRNLRKLGVRRDQAVTHGFSSKGAWVMSSSQAVHEALSITGPAAPGPPQDRLTQEGLVSLLTIWQKLTARKCTARCGPACRVVREGPRGNPGPYPDLCSGVFSVSVSCSCSAKRCS